MAIEDNKAYELLKKEWIEDIHSEGYLLRHKKSGARVMLLSNSDENKVFHIAFRTPPADSTGVAHILEHSVLCGSKEFPLKDPFVELVKGSLNTFLNAMTYPDKTMYPVASCNDQDFQNLMHVYMDAVFYPNIYSREEIFRQEGWSYHLEDVDGPLTYNGVVYNEMKGVFSSADEIVDREVFYTLFPDTPYGVESGGDPTCIPDLTYENFLKFHSTYYHPANSYIYLYGDMDMEEKLQWMDETYLSKFDEIQVESEIPLQPAFSGMVEHVIEYPVSDEGNEERNTYMTYGMVAGTSEDVELCLTFDVLDYVLLSAPGAPLRQALLDADIAKDVNGGYDNSVRQPFFAVELKGTDVSDKEQFLQIVNDTLTKIADEGIDPKAIDGGINYLEFRYREADYGSYPSGLMYGIVAMTSWLYDDDKPFDYLKQLEHFESLKKKAKEGYFEEIIRKYLLNNPHSVLVIAEPKKGLAAEREAALEKKLADYKASLSQEELEKLVERTRSLQEFQEREEDPEDLKRLPLLKRSDIRRETIDFYNDVHRVMGTTVLHHNLETNGISYLDLLFDIEKVPDRLVPYMGLLKSVLTFVDTAHYSYNELFNEINAQTGGINFGISSYAQGKGKPARRFFGFRSKYLTDKESFVFSMLREIVFTSKLDDKKRLREIIAQQKSRMETGMAAAGHSTAVQRAGSYHLKGANFAERVDGLDYLRFIEDLDKNFDVRIEETIENLKTLMHMIFRPENLFVSVTVNESGYAGVEQQIALLRPLLYTDAVEEGAIEYHLEQKNEGFYTAGQVQYVAVSGNFKKAGFEYTGALRMLRVILSYDYLWMNIRVKGGAYGCMSGFRRSGETFLASYRDPHFERTLDIFKGTPEYLRNFKADERTMTQYVIGTISELDVPMNPAAKGSLSLGAWFNELTKEDMQRERDEILGATEEDIQKLADLIQAVLDQGNLCAVGSETTLKKDQKLLKSVEPLAR